jgi:hypothetical protein
MWHADHESPDGVSAFETDVVAVDGDTAVVSARALRRPVRQEYRDLWVVLFNDEGPVHLVRAVAVLTREAVVRTRLRPPST